MKFIIIIYTTNNYFEMDKKLGACGYANLN